LIRSPIGLRLNPDPARPIKDAIRDAARLGARGVVLDAAGDIAPDRLSDTGRRDLAHTLRSIDVGLIALNLPTRRAFDSFDDLDVRLARADRAFALSYELGARIVLVRAGQTPLEDDAARRGAFVHALGELGRRAEHRGVRLAIETVGGPVALLKEILSSIASPGLGASIDPAALLRSGQDPAASVVALGSDVVHAYAVDAWGGSGPIAGNHGVLDWTAYLGSLEEINYRGYLTIWPDSSQDLASGFAAIKTRLDRF
jgi:sugar phosphate isomerase/epimerase